MKLPIISGIINKIQGKEDEEMPDDARIPEYIAPPDPTNFVSNQFGLGADAFYKAQELSLQVDAKDFTLRDMQDSALSLRLKRALLGEYMFICDRALILSDFSEKNMKAISIIKTLIRMKAVLLTAAYPSDKQNPIFVRFYLELQSLNDYRHSRTAGEQRERIMGAFMHIKYESKQRLEQRRTT